MLSKRLATLLHVILNLAQVAISVLLIKLSLLPLAVAVALLGKWRIISLNLYRLYRGLRANSCDIIVITSTVLLMDFYQANVYMLGALAVFLAVWLLILKPATQPWVVALQGALCNLLGLSTLWLVGLEQDLPGLIVLPLVWIISYSAARQLGLPLDTDDDQRERIIIPLIWATLISQLGWLSWLWAITYQIPGDLFLPQIALLSTALGYFSLNHFYVYRDERKKLPKGFVWQQILFCVLVVVAVIALTPWSA